MQVLSTRIRLISLILVFVIVFGCFPVRVSASGALDETYPSSITNWKDFYVCMSNFFELTYRSLLAGASDIFWGSSGSAVNTIKNSAFYCAANTESSGAAPIHKFINTTTSFREGVCKYCGLSWVEFMDALEEDENKSVSSLDSSTATKYLGWHGYVGLTSSNKQMYRLLSDLNNLDFPFFYFLKECGVADKVMVLAVTSTYLTGFYFDVDGILCMGHFANPYGSDNAAYLTLYDYDSLELVHSFVCSSYKFFYSSSYAFAYPNYLSTKCAYFDWDSNGNFFPSSVDQIFFKAYCYTKNSSDSLFSDVSALTPIYFQYDSTSYPDGFTRLTNRYQMNSFSLDSDFLLKEPSTSDGSEAPPRAASLMGLLAGWNSGNGYLDNYGNVNFLMGALNSSGTLDDVYSPAVYDEETLIFTEPVTGAQYQTSGWTYDYNSRSYDIEVESGTFLIGELDITQIVCTYGDDAVTIVYYDSYGNAVQSDEFAYVMVSQNPCSLTGHINSMEITKEATCTSTGERVYTCTVCGNVEVEDIPMKGHSHKYSEIRSPTCTDAGLALYSCSTCGDEVSESLDPLGHDWLATEVAETTYSLPDGTSCPDCGDSNYVSVLDDINGVYTCTCNSCNAEWSVAAEKSFGYTVYTCSRCGETKTVSDNNDNGLFRAIGNFIANGINWCTEKLTQLVDSLTSITDTFNQYLVTISQQSSSFPAFLTSAINSLPEDLMAIIWFTVILFIVGAVLKMWFE